jgi:hypothetical protein
MSHAIRPCPSHTSSVENKAHTQRSLSILISLRVGGLNARVVAAVSSDELIAYYDELMMEFDDDVIYQVGKAALE